MEIKFHDLEKECKECAEEFVEELELLPIFLNYFPEVQEKWLYELELTTSDVMKVRSITEEYAKKKVGDENKELPKERAEVIKIENKVLKEIYEGRVLKLQHISREFIFAYLRSKFPDAVILGPKQLEKLEQLTLFKEHKKRFPMNYLIFEPDSKRIIGYEVIKSERKAV